MIDLDGISYRGSDSGCRLASHYLGKQSTCLECPFDNCFFVVQDKQAEELIACERDLRTAAIRDYRRVFGDIFARKWETHNWSLAVYEYRQIFELPEK